MNDNICFICQARPGDIIAFPSGVRYVCEDCGDKIPKSLADQEPPQRELYCPACGMEATISTFALIPPDDPKAQVLDHLIGPYCAHCDRCDNEGERLTFLRTTHPSPEAALDYWRDHPEAICTE